jgi:hypothetical protein
MNTTEDSRSGYPALDQQVLAIDADTLRFPRHSGVVLGATIVALVSFTVIATFALTFRAKLGEEFIGTAIVIILLFGSVPLILALSCFLRSRQLERTEWKVEEIISEIRKSDTNQAWSAPPSS